MDTSSEAPQLNESTTATISGTTSNSGNSTGTTSTNSDQLVMSVKCYVKLLLHCMKYPHATVNGVILAGDSSKGNPSTSAGNSKGGKKQKSTGQVKSTTSNNSQSSPQANTSSSGGGSSGEGNRMELVDVVPLFHLGHGLTPMTELALLQVSAYCRENNLTIAGVYQANRYFHDSNPDIFIQRIGEKITEQNSNSSLTVPSILLMVNNLNLAANIEGTGPIESVFNVYSYSDGKWKSKQGLLKFEHSSISSDIVNELVLNEKLQLKLKDFDGHLDDINNDWTNGTVNGAIGQYIESSMQSSS